MQSRSNSGGYEPRFVVERVDGDAIPSGRRYMVLSFDGSDPEAIEALRHYAALKASANPQLASDLLRQIEDPDNAPAQHRYA